MKKNELKSNLKTAECVTPRHPDKMCDRISDSILDWYLERDKYSRVAVETMGGHGRVYIIGEVTSETKAIGQKEIDNIVREITGESNEVEFCIKTQSPEIAQGVDIGGAGDQGIMVGYGCDENSSFIPQELYLARDLCRFVYSFYKQDGKTQVTIDDDGCIETIVISFCRVGARRLKTLVEEWLKGKDYDPNRLKLYCNPSGDWNIGGFAADTGLTGRKLAVDNYGPRIPLGGGAFSGKDATKVDRSGAYAARKITIDILKRQKAKEVLVKIAYSIGIAEPVMVTALVDGENQVVNGYNLSPQGIIDMLKLRQANYRETAEWGHFGNDFLWDK